MSAFSSVSSAWDAIWSARQAERGRVSRAWSDWAVKIGIVAAGTLVVILFHQYSSTSRAIGLLKASLPGRILLYAAMWQATITTLWTGWRLILAIRYRPAPVVEDHRLPRITVVVPAYNEGPLVARTLRHLANADYPADKVQIIVVDDGSQDDTWQHICAVAKEVGPRLIAMHFDENRGKRWALWEGFRRGTGQVFITVDSDSIVAPDALKSVVSPLVLDKSVGAVAGNVTVLNTDQGLIPRMLSVRYVMTFDYKRTAQSMIDGGSVMCVAGALAAYRRSCVMPILDQWLHQTYLGGMARAGEDHAMTNFITMQGYKVRYQSSAHVKTNSPTTYVGLAKMFLRWGRSNVRETVHMAKWVFTPFRPGRLLGLRFNFLMVASGLVIPYAFLTTGLILSLMYPVIFGLKMLAMCVTGASMSMIFFAAKKRSTDAIYAIPYGFYAMIPLGWVWPYALLTSHKSVWMTRHADRRDRVPTLRRLANWTRTRLAVSWNDLAALTSAVPANSATVPAPAGTGPIPAQPSAAHVAPALITASSIIYDAETDDGARPSRGPARRPARSRRAAVAAVMLLAAGFAVIGSATLHAEHDLASPITPRLTPVRLIDETTTVPGKAADAPIAPCFRF